MATATTATMDPTFGERVSEAASAAWQTTVDYAGRAWTWICDTSSYLADRIGAALAAAWNFVQPHLAYFGNWLNQNRMEAAIVVAAGAAIGYVVHMLLSRT